MSGIGKKITEKARSLISKYYDPTEAGNKAGIEFLNRGGFLFWRLEQMGIIDTESLIAMDANYSKITLPWLNIGGQPEHFDRFDAFKDLFNYYEGLERVLNVERKAKLKELNEKILDENLITRQANTQREAEGFAPVPEKAFVTAKDLDNIPFDPELEEFRETLRGYLQWGSSILLGLSYDDPDDNKTLVLNKPIMIDAGKTRIIEGGGGYEAQPPLEQGGSG